MTRSIILLITILLVSIVVSGQVPAGQVETSVSADLLSPWEVVNGKVIHSKLLHNKSCLSLTTLQWGCSNSINISYGNRIGDNWDILSINGTQSRMIDLGPAEWSEKIEVPYIAPFKALRPGEKRHLAVHLWGADGADGRPGVNGDGISTQYSPRPRRKSNAAEPVSKQVSSQIESSSGERFVDNYNPLLEARKGHVYAIRVVEGILDQYYLLRVDDIIRGQKISISLKKADPPLSRPIF